MEFEVTNEEIEALKLYKGANYEPINQMLISNSEIDVNMLSDITEENAEENLDKAGVSYSKANVKKYIEIVKKLYSLMQKTYLFTNLSKGVVNFYRGTNISEIERIKSEPYIDRFISATDNNNIAQEKYASNWNRPAVIKIELDKDIPYIDVNEILNIDSENKEYIISPFTIIDKFKETQENVLETNNKTVKNYNMHLSKQEVEELSKDEKNGLYTYIINTADAINRKLKEAVNLEKENYENYENIRKLEQLLSKYELETEKPESEADEDDIKRINKQLKELKKDCSDIFKEKKDIINFVTNWKRNIILYLMSECYDIEKELQEKKTQYFQVDTKNIDKEDSKEAEENDDEELEENNEELDSDSEKTENKEDEDSKENDANSEKDSENDESKEETENDEKENSDETNLENTENNNEEQEEKESSELEENQEQVEKEEQEDDEELSKYDPDDKRYIAKKECKENIKVCEKLLENIQNLISKQQNHAKVAGNLGTAYSALNNGFEMKKVAENLDVLLKNIKLKVNSIIAENEENNENKEELNEKLDNISQVNLQISTLFNYLNNPKSSIGISNITRFDEMSIIEENELKRGIYQTVRDSIGEAELKKLKDDLSIIEDKSPIERLLGIFTGRNRLDEIMLEQIEVRQNAIRKTLAQKLSIAQNYSIHEIMAKIRMFIEENEDDELIEDEILDLKQMKNKLENNYVILDYKVDNIIKEREGRNLPIDNNKKISKKEALEIDTYRFLNKYGYDIEENAPDVKYQDTMSSEISRIIEYINSSNVLQ